MADTTYWGIHANFYKGVIPLKRMYVPQPPTEE